MQQITRETLVYLGACYVTDDATPEQIALVARLPATLTEIAACEDVPLADVAWLVGRVSPRVAARWALWCAGRALRYAGPWHDAVRDALRMIRNDPQSADAAADTAAWAAADAAAWAAADAAAWAVVTAAWEEDAAAWAAVAAWAAADAAAWAAADAAAWAVVTAAWEEDAAERSRQRAQLVRMLGGAR